MCLVKMIIVRDLGKKMMLLLTLKSSMGDAKSIKKVRERHSDKKLN